MRLDKMRLAFEPATSLPRIIKRQDISFNPIPIIIKHQSNLIVHRENGIVISLEYHCKCGHIDKFICE
jgi:hypothetical protein